MVNFTTSFLGWGGHPDLWYLPISWCKFSHRGQLQLLIWCHWTELGRDVSSQLLWAGKSWFLTLGQSQKSACLLVFPGWFRHSGHCNQLFGRRRNRQKSTTILSLEPRLIFFFLEATFQSINIHVPPSPFLSEPCTLCTICYLFLIYTLFYPFP